MDTITAYKGFNQDLTCRGRVTGAAGNALFLAERDDGNIVHVWAGVVGKDGVEPNVWYALKGGVLVAVELED